MEQGAQAHARPSFFSLQDIAWYSVYGLELGLICGKGRGGSMLAGALDYYYIWLFYVVRDAT